MSNPMSNPVPPSAIDVHTSFFPLAFLFLLFKPRVAINGTVYDQFGWGDTRIPVPAGRYQVEVWVPYLFFPTMGRNGAVVDVPAGAIVQVRWRAPWFVFLQGKVSVTGPFALEQSAAPTGAPPPPGDQLAPPPTTALPAPPPPSVQPPAPPQSGSAF